MRDFRTRVKNPFNVHFTGRQCDNPSCGGDLHDTIVNFGESINKTILTRAIEHSQIADLCICLGTSLLVKPAMLLPCLSAEKGGKVAIVNL